MKLREKVKKMSFLNLKYFTAILVVLFSSVSFAISFEDLKSVVSVVKKVDQVINKNSSDENDLSSSLRDKKVSEYLKRLSESIARQRDLENIFSIEVINTEIVESAISIQDETIFISKGMLFSIHNEAELVSLIGHEIGHYKLGHVARRYQKPVGLQVIGDVLDATSGVPDIVKSARWQMEDINYYQFEQNKEEEADEFGALVARDLGYNPYSFADLFNRLSGMERLGFLSKVTSIKTSHKSLQGRAEHIKSYLSNLKVPSRGRMGEENYLKNVGHLGPDSNSNNYRVEDDELNQIISNLKLKNKNNERLSAQEFISIMDRLRLLATKYGVLEQLKDSISSPEIIGNLNKNFMKEKLKQAKPWWRSANPTLLNKFKNAFALIGRMGLGFIPVIGDASDLYEVLTGKDFVSGEDLGFGGRLLSAMGVLVGAGQQWREVAHGLENVENLIHTKIPGVSTKEVSSVAKAADKLAEEGNLYGRSKVGKTYNAHFEDGPLTDREALDSFSGKKYTEITPGSGEKFYRVGDKEGPYWSRVKPTSQIRSMSENAIHPDWNKFEEVHELKIPENYNGNFYEGFSGNMSGKVNKLDKETNQIIAQIQSGSFFHGGGNQVYIPKNLIKVLEDNIK